MYSLQLWPSNNSGIGNRMQLAPNLQLGKNIGTVL